MLCIVFRLLCVVIFALSGYGCSAKVNPAESDSAISASGGAPATQLLKQKTVAKPGASVSIKNPQPLVVSGVGVHQLTIVVASPSYPGAINIRLSGSDGLQLLSSPQDFRFELNEQGEYQLPVTVNAQSEGRHYVRLHVAIAQGEQLETRAVSLIVQVGEPAVRAKKLQAPVSDAVITLPAQETVSPR